MKDGEKLLSIAAAARAIGVSRQTLWSQCHRTGAVRHHHGKVYLSEVRADVRRNVDSSRAPPEGPTRRGRSDADTEFEVIDFDNLDNPDVPDASDPDAPDMDVDATFMEARRREKIEAARLKQLARMRIEGALVLAEPVAQMMHSYAREMRDDFQAWPARVAPVIAADLNIDGGVMLVTLERHVRDFLLANASRAKARADQVAGKVASGL